MPLSPLNNRHHLLHICCQSQGRIQDFLNEGATKLRTDRTSVPVGTGVSEGDVPPQKWTKIVIFKVNSHDLVHSFFLGRPHKIRHPISAKNRGGTRLRVACGLWLNTHISQKLHPLVSVTYIRFTTSPGSHTPLC